MMISGSEDELQHIVLYVTCDMTKLHVMYTFFLFFSLILSFTCCTMQQDLTLPILLAIIVFIALIIILPYVFFHWISPLTLSHYLNMDMVISFPMTIPHIMDTSTTNNDTPIRETWRSLIAEMLMHPPPVALPHQNHYSSVSHTSHHHNNFFTCSA